MIVRKIAIEEKRLYYLEFKLPVKGSVFMEPKETRTFIDVDYYLKKIGKRVFVNFYYEFKNFELSDKELAKKIYEENPSSKSSSQGFRVPRAREIFQYGQAVAALKVIIDSAQVDTQTKEKAKQILCDEMRLLNFEEDSVSEREFILGLNNFFSRGPEEFEYRNVPEKPCEAKCGETKRYGRNSVVSKNALSKAKYQCEANESHSLFKRKDGVTPYTEPHHIVPLSAQCDFPDASLDREQNIVSLCSNCHNQLHYGCEIDSILKPIFESRKELLKLIGVEIEYDDLKKYYR